MQLYLTVLAVLCVIGTACAQSKVNVDVYYESLCPDSRKFITQQLKPTLQGSLKNSVTLRLIPYGKSTYQTRGSDVEFECHHGPNECYGNKVHACAIEHIQVDSYQRTHTKDSKTLEFVSCLMENSNMSPSNAFPTNLCVRNTDIQQGPQIENCANGTAGSTLLARYGEMTNKFMQPLTSVPTVVFNSQYDKKDQDLAMSDFKLAVCKHLSAPRPDECPEINSAPVRVAATALVLLAAVTGAML